MIKFFCGLIAVLLFSTSTVFSQDIFIAYRKGSQWGYADTLGNIVIEPVYDEVVKGWTPMNKLLVARNNKWGVVSEKGKVTIPLEYSYVYPTESGYFFTGTKTAKDDYLHALYNSKGKLLIKPEQQDISFINDRMIMVRSQGALNRSGVGRLNSAGNKITWLIPRTNKLVYFTPSDSIIHVETETKAIDYKITKTNEVQKVKEEDLILDEGVMFEEVVGNEEGPSGPAYTVTVSLAIHDTINAKGEKLFNLVKTTDLTRKKTETTLIEGCDQVTIVKYPNGYKEYFSSEIRTPSVTDQWAIVRKGGKYGAYFSGPKEAFIPFEYDSIGQEILPFECETIALKVKRNGKWGLIDLKNSLVADFIFDGIMLPTTLYGRNYKTCFEMKHGLIVKKGARFHLLTSSKNDIYPKGFERAINADRLMLGLILFEGPKKGLYHYGHLFIPSYEGEGEFRTVETGRYPLATVVDKGQKLLGFVDKKGIVYFRD